VSALLDTLAANPWSPIWLLGLWAVLCPLGVPVTPLVLAAGAVFGLGLGWLYNMIGAMLGASLSYYLAGKLGRELIVRLVGERRERQVEEVVHRHGFGFVMRSRLLPIPFALVNYAAALAGFPFRRFAAATFLGLLPALLLYTWFADALVRAATTERAGLVLNLGLVLLAMLALTFLPRLFRRRGASSPEAES
jgi:uncharacterized membrane protein YdjX (TVP38/TMEM64 family)